MEAEGEVMDKQEIIDEAIKVLNDIASWGEGDFVNGSFDEPHSAKKARDFLKKVGL